MISIYHNKEIRTDLWEKLEENSDYANPFQTADFYGSFQDLKEITSDAFACGDDNAYSAIVVVVLQKEKGYKSYFSKRGIIYGGFMISRTSAPEDLGLLFRYLHNYYKKSLIYLETRNLFDYSPFRRIFSENGWEYVPYLNFQLECNDIAQVWKNLNRRRRREIKIAQENKTECSVAISVEELESVYRIIEDLYKNKIKKPVLPIEFFIRFFSSTHCRVIVVKTEGRIIGGVICAVYRKKAIYGWYGAGLEKDFGRNSPVVMGIYSAIEFACNNGFEYYDFMGAGQPDQEYGVRKFKEEFGGKMVEHGRFLFRNRPVMYFIGKSAIKMYSFLKK